MGGPYVGGYGSYGNSNYRSYNDDNEDYEAVWNNPDVREAFGAPLKTKTGAFQCCSATLAIPSIIALLVLGSCCVAGHISPATTGYWVAALSVPVILTGVLASIQGEKGPRTVAAIVAITYIAISILAVLATQGIVSAKLLGWSVIVPTSISIVGLLCFSSLVSCVVVGIGGLALGAGAGPFGAHSFSRF